MRSSRALTVVPPIVAALAAMLTFATARPADAYQHNGWCGPSQEADWACGWEGMSSLTPPGEPERYLALRSALPLPPDSRIRTAPRGNARLTFRDAANCTVGGKSAGASEVVARWEPDVLMRQIRGDSSCTMRNRAAPVTTFCEASEAHCPIRISAHGTFLLEGPRSYSEAAASASSSDESFARHARVVVCNGVARVKVEGKPEEAIGRSGGHSHFVITIDQAIAHVQVEVATQTESAFAEATASIFALTVVGTQPGLGPCGEAEVQEQEGDVEA